MMRNNVRIGRETGARPDAASASTASCAVTPTSVDRCIAVAAHGRRCQQTTYRGSPYCWHHTQSRKVWAPSRVSKTRARRPDADAAETVEEIPATGLPAPSTFETAAALAAALSPSQMSQLRAFLARGGTGVFRIDKADGTVVDARVDPRLGRALEARLSVAAD